MTVTYSLEVSRARFCGFAKLLARWRGSIYKILWKEFIVWSLGYATLSLVYRCLLNGHQREAFERVVLFVDSCVDFIPLSFVLGFYVSLVVGRWWSQYEAIPWPDRLCLMIASYVHGADERSRAIRRTLARYLLLLQVFAFQSVSTAVKKRFPTTQHLVAAGMLTKEEQSVYEKINFPYGKWWLPCQWFASLLMRAKKEGRIKDSILLDALFRELLDYRSSCGTMMSYDWISVPLVYTQVVTLATYVYAVSLVIGRQYLDVTKNYTNHEVDLYVPYFTILQVIFYVGWLKVAEQILNPYGEDDDDFELNWCVDRTVHVVYLIVDHLQTKHPRVSKDFFWDEVEPKLPQTKHSAKGTENHQIGSAFHLEVEDTKYLPMDSFLEQDRDENMYSGDSVRRRSLGNIRSSFLMKVLRPAFGQSFRKKSFQTDTAKNSLQCRGHTHCDFIHHDNNKSSNLSTPVTSRKSSYRSHHVKAASPSHSRSSSVSARTNSLNQPRYKSFNSHEGAEKQLSGGLHEADGTTARDINQLVKTGPVSIEESLPPVSEDKSSEVEPDASGMRLESSMPPIPEEGSPRVASLVSVVCEKTEQENDIQNLAEKANDVQNQVKEAIDVPNPVKEAIDVLNQVKEANGVQNLAKEASDVQNLVKEANEVLKELEKTITAQGHRKECESKGYESCCSFSSDASSDDEESDKEQLKTDDFAVVEFVGAIV